MPRAKTPPNLQRHPGPRSTKLTGITPGSAAATAALVINPDVAFEQRQAAAEAHANATAERLEMDLPYEGHLSDAVVERRSVSSESIPVSEGITADALASPQRMVDPELSSEDELAADIARIRGLRRPLGSFSQKLALDPIPGYHQHWFNDTGARIDEAQANGWAHVKDQDGKPKRRPVGMGRDNGVMYAYAMKLPLVLWLEDTAQRHTDARGRVEQLKASPFKTRPGDKPDASDAHKFYSPTAGGDAVQVVKGQ